MAQPGPSDETTLAPSAEAETRLSGSGSSGATGGATSGSVKRATPASHSGWLSTSQAGDGRFASGTILADRYRIIGLAGRGGMGEVYRAEDLRLGQTVALKFLPESVTQDPTRLAQFHNEVRTARQISHRNVCRVYDIGEADDRIFLTMEYVDGEDLSTLLRRVGRFPQDRAIEIARQICAGLAAAHEFDVLHRDLKPANVMLDADGRVRITDFGLAGIAGEIKDIRAGTPAYMAPEQLAGREVSIRSDIFALGLVLYEIFTGKRAFDAKNVNDLLRMHDEGLTITPSAAVRDIDPAVERIILRCLDRDPQRRPPSALAVAAALPGGDPLAAALAAGETPSPEMVANAGNREAIAPAWGLTALGAVLAIMTAFVVFIDQQTVMHRIAFDKPPDVLLDRARTLHESLDYPDRPADSASGFDLNGDYFGYVLKSRDGGDRWREITSGRDQLAQFWYRTSPRTLAPRDIRNRVQVEDPSFAETGMTTMILDTRGRLMQFDVLAAQPPAAPAAAAAASTTATATTTGTPAAAPAAAPSAPPATNWDPLFTAADLPKDRFTPATPTWIPRGFADTRAAWTGTLKELGDTPVRIEAASYLGRITSFAIVLPWTPPRTAHRDTSDLTSTISRYLFVIVELGLSLAALVMARRNMRLGRGNLQGAFRIAAFTFVISLISWFIGAKHVAFTERETKHWFDAIGYALFNAGNMWLIYLALEPIVRRVWPRGLIGWNRLLAGEWRDPLVGWSLLCGVACGVALSLTVRLVGYAVGRLEYVAPLPWVYPILFVDSTAYYVSKVLDWFNDSVNTGLFIVLCYAIARGTRAGVGRNALAVGVMSLILMAAFANEFLSGKNFPLEIGFMLVVVIVIIATMLRFGVLALTVMFFVNNVMNAAPLTLRSSDWYAPTAWFSLALILGIAVYGFVLSRGGEPLFGRLVAD
jgi:hypothetical protein